jgi:hypothetical protein
MKVSGQLHVPAALPLERLPATHRQEVVRSGEEKNSSRLPGIEPRAKISQFHAIFHKFKGYKALFPCYARDMSFKSTGLLVWILTMFDKIN